MLQQLRDVHAPIFFIADYSVDTMENRLYRILNARGDALLSEELIMEPDPRLPVPTSRPRALEPPLDLHCAHRIKWRRHAVTPHAGEAVASAARLDATDLDFIMDEAPPPSAATDLDFIMDEAPPPKRRRPLPMPPAGARAAAHADAVGSASAAPCVDELIEAASASVDALSCIVDQLRDAHSRVR